MEQLAFDDPVFTVHCFFNCGHITRAEDPKTSGDAMERHYTEKHTADINRALGFLGSTRRTPAP